MTKNHSYCAGHERDEGQVRRRVEEDRGRDQQRPAGAGREDCWPVMTMFIFLQIHFQIQRHFQILKNQNKNTDNERPDKVGNGASSCGESSFE